MRQGSSCLACSAMVRPPSVPQASPDRTSYLSTLGETRRTFCTIRLLSSMADVYMSLNFHAA